MGMLAAIIVPLVAVMQVSAPTFGSDVEFMKKHVDVIVLSNASGQARVAVVPEYQGRVMTSTAAGDDGMSFGWINRDIIAKEKAQPHITVVGGEDRIWFGPEGGQFSVFFKKGDPFEMKYWQVPSEIDFDKWDVLKQSSTSVTFGKKITFTNYSGNKLTLEAERTVNLLNRSDVYKNLKTSLPDGVKSVAFETINKITNTGNQAWTKDTGMLSIWVLSMLQASPETTVVAPYNKGDEKKIGKIVNDEYFGKVPSDRLKADDDKGVVYFKADAGHRSKIGLTPQRSKPVMGSYDAANGLLTIAQYTLPQGNTDYVNSMWEMQDEPLKGDAINSYNDGPNELGNSLGNFYELETSSPAAALGPNESITHVHRTIHLQGDAKDLDGISTDVFGVGVKEISGALK